MQDVAAQLAVPGTRACLVAPPGAGKTICSLAIAAELGSPVEVRVPTTALRLQWEARIAEALVAIVDGAPPPPIQVATYAAKASLAPGALVILDEAHHVTQAWGRALQAELDAEHRVLGVTATPPHGAPGWDRFVDLVGADPIEIPAPPLVREGQLCPFQDLVWPVRVDLDDLPELQALDAALRALETAHSPRFGVWETRRLTEDLWTLTEKRFSGESALLVALCRLRTARGIALPADLPADAELTAAPTVHDRALALWSSAPDDPVLAAGLRAAGFRLRKGGPVLRDDVAWRGLASSGTRIRGALDLLVEEHRVRGDQLRALLVCDRDAEGDRLSARQVLRALVNDPRTDALDPILVTGSVFWVDDDLWPRLENRLPALPWQAREGHHELDTAGWSTAERVALATRLLTEGTTRCLVGTRHLLGEGWDCPAVCCVVDLTGITASVTVQQIRGRALRPDPADPSKVASLWDVVALAPGVPDGDRMLRKLQERHRHTFGVDDRGRIVAGVARIDPRLASDAVTVAGATELLRARMVERLETRGDTAERWSVGQDYRDARVWQVACRAASAPRARLPAALRGAAEVPAGPASVAVLHRWRVVRFLALTLLGGPSVGVGIGLLAASLLPMLLGPLVTFVLPAGLGGGILAGAAIAAVYGPAALRLGSRDAAIAAALHAAMKSLSSDVGTLRVDDGCVWTTAPDGGQRFASALATLLGPVRHPRYLLVENSGMIWSVPDELGARRDLADTLAAAWAAHVGPCSVFYARSEQGKSLLRASWRSGGHLREAVDVLESWE